MTMLPSYLLGLLLCLIFRIGGGTVTGENPQNADGILVKDDNESFNMGNRVSINSEQLAELEQALNIIYKRFFGPPRTKLTLRSNGIATTISTIGNALCNYINDVMKQFGVVPIRKGMSNLKSSDPLRFSVSYELLRMPLEIKPIVEQIQGQINKYISKNNYVKSGYKRADLSLKFRNNNSSKEWQYLAIFSALKTYTSKLYDCLEKTNSSTYDLKEALGKLMNISPKIVTQILRRRLMRPLPKNLDIQKSRYTELHGFVCQAISEDTRIDYLDCIAEAKRVNDCVNCDLDDSYTVNNDKHAATPSNRFIEAIKSLDESCVNVTGTLGFSIECNGHGRLLKNKEFSYVGDSFLGDLKKSPVLRRMTDELVSIVKKSHTSADAAREVATLMAVRHNAMEMKVKLGKSARKNDDAIYNGISEKLADYEQQLTKMGLRMMKNVNDAASDVEKIFVDSTSAVSRHDLSPNVRALKCFSELLESMFDINWRYKNSEYQKKSTKGITSHAKSFLSKVPKIAETAVGIRKKSRNEALKKWTDSMKRVGQGSSYGRSSALTTLANTFLLATMFYECMAVLAGVIHREEVVSVPQSYSAENYVPENWLSQNKKPSSSSDRGKDERKFETVPDWQNNDYENSKYDHEVYNDDMLHYSNPSRIFNN